MKHSAVFLKKKNVITALMLVACMGIPVSSFAFRNPNQNPRDIVPLQEKLRYQCQRFISC